MSPEELIIISVIGLMLGGLVFLCVLVTKRDSLLQKEGVTTQAKILRIDIPSCTGAKKIANVFYNYNDSNGKLYTGRFLESFTGLRSSYKTYKPGDVIDIKYLQHKPSYSRPVHELQS